MYVKILKHRATFNEEYVKLAEFIDVSAVLGKDKLGEAKWNEFIKTKRRLQEVEKRLLDSDKLVLSRYVEQERGVLLAELDMLATDKVYNFISVQQEEDGYYADIEELI